MKETYKEFYKEPYYTGPRAKSTWRRLTRFLKPSQNKKPRFNIIKKINEQKNSQGIISFTLFGDGNTQKFVSELVNPLIKNSKIISQKLPGWVGRIYISSSIPPHIYSTLSNSGFELFVMEENKQAEYIGLLWRFLPAGETKPFLVCDADMLLDSNNYFIPSINEIHNWLKTDKPFFRRKHFPINLFWSISAGLWGGKPTKNNEPPVPDIKKSLEYYQHDWFGCDESFLQKKIWPLFKQKGHYNAYSNAEKTGFSLYLLIFIIICFILLFQGIKYIQKKRVSK